MYSEIPQHPFVPFSELARRFGEKHIKGSFARRLFSWAMNLWGLTFRISSVEAAIPRALKRGENPLDIKSWGFSELFYAEMSASLILSPDPETDPALKAAQVIKGLQDFKSKVETQTLKEELEGKKPLDMSRYRYLFSRLMISELRGSAPVHRVVDKTAGDYAVLWVQAIPYKLPLTARDGKPLSYEQLAYQIRRILEDDRDSSTAALACRALVGELTWVNNPATIPIFSRVRERNQQAMSIIDEAALVVSIDRDDSPKSESEVLHAVHRKNFHNRDHRRSMYAVVTGNGRVGINTNPWCGIGGTLSAKLVSELHKSCLDLQAAFPRVQLKAGPELFQKIEIDTSFLTEEELGKAREALSKALNQGFFAGDRIVHKLEGIGSRGFKERNLGADAAFHCGLHLAYQKSFSKCPIVGNFINLRNVKFGDIWRYNATTSEMKAFVANPNAATLFQAAKAHNAEIKRQKSAEDEAYLGVMTVLRGLDDGKLGMLGLRTLVLILNAFCKDFLRRFFLHDIWVSHIPKYSGFELVGRYGINLSYVPGPGIAGHYSIFDDHIYLCLMSGSKGGLNYHDQKRFMGNLEQALREVCALADQHDESSGSASETGPSTPIPLAARPE
jgi:hypothetical protein